MRKRETNEKWARDKEERRKRPSRMSGGEKWSLQGPVSPPCLTTEAILPFPLVPKWPT